MFDLFRSRDKAVRILLGGILVVVSLSMLTYLIPSYNSGGSDPNDMVIAEVGKDAITVPEVQKAIQATMRGRQIPASILPNYIPQLVDQMIVQRALAYEAERLGFQVTDAELRESIRQLAPNLFPDGKFVGTEMYASFLAQQNITTEEFESDLRRQMLVGRLRAIASQGVVVTPADVEREFHAKNDEIKIQYVKLTADMFKGESQPGAADLQSYYKANIASFQTPEKRSLVILLADQAKLEQGLEPSDADLQRLYTQNLDSFRTPERVRVRHILLKTADKPAADDAKIKAKADDLLKQIKAGADFAELAKKYSEDPGSANNPKGAGELPDWISRGQTVPEFERAAFTLKPGQTSDVIKTQYGYHIIQVLAHEDARLRPFAEVKNELASQWKKQRVNDILQNISDKAQAALQKDPTHPDKVAAEFNMQLIRADDVAPGQPLPDIGTSADFDQSIAGLKAGEVSAPVALPGNKIVLAEVSAVIPSRPMPFDEVKDRIQSIIVQNRSLIAVQNHARTLMEAAKKSGDLAAAAKAAGMSVTVSAPFSRSGQIMGLGPASYLTDAFTSPVNSVVGPFPEPDGTVVAQVLQHIPADTAKLAAESAAIRDDLKQQKARERNTLFEEGIREALTKQGKIKVRAAVLKRLIASFGSSS